MSEEEKQTLDNFEPNQDVPEEPVQEQPEEVQVDDEQPQETQQDYEYQDEDVEDGGEDSEDEEAQPQVFEVDITIGEGDNTQTITEEVDLERLKRSYSIERASQQKFQAAAKMRKDVLDILDTVKTDVGTALTSIFGSQEAVDEAIEGWYQKRFELETMPEEEKQRLTVQEENERLRKELEEIREREKSEQQKAKEAAIVQQLQPEVEASMSDFGIPLESRHVDYIIQACKQAIENKIPVTIDDIVRQRKYELIQDAKILNSVSSDQLTEEFGEVASKVRDADVSRFKEKRNTPKRKSDNSTRKDESSLTDQYADIPTPSEWQQRNLKAMQEEWKAQQRS